MEGRPNKRKESNMSEATMATAAGGGDHLNQSMISQIEADVNHRMGTTAASFIGGQIS